MRTGISPEQLERAFILGNFAQVIQFHSALQACFVDAFDTGVQEIHAGESVGGGGARADIRQEPGAHVTSNATWYGHKSPSWVT